jgi:hypothetical protein
MLRGSNRWEAEQVLGGGFARLATEMTPARVEPATVRFAHRAIREERARGARERERHGNETLLHVDPPTNRPRTPPELVARINAAQSRTHRTRTCVNESNLRVSS